MKVFRNLAIAIALFFLLPSLFAQAPGPVINVTADSTTIRVGSHASFSATRMVNLGNGETIDRGLDKRFGWSTSDPAVAVVDQNGTVTGVAPGTATITATTNQAPFSGSAIITVLQPVPVPKYLYVANQIEGISAFAVEQHTGELTPVPGSPFPAGPNSAAIASDPTGRFVYVADNIINAIGTYSVDPATGTLSKVIIKPTPFWKFAGKQPRALAVHPSGRWLYAANYESNDLSAYSIDPDTGILTDVAGSPFLAGTYPQAIAVDPAGRFAYVINCQSNDVIAYRIDESTGALEQIGSVAASLLPKSIAISPDGNTVYVSTFGSDIQTLLGFHIKPETGLPEGGPILNLPAGSSLFGLAFDPSGRWLYSADGPDSTTSVYRADPSTGALSLVQRAGYGGGLYGYAITVDPSGQFVYMTDLNGTVMAFTIDQEQGTLSPVPGSPFPVGHAPFGITVTHE